MKLRTGDRTQIEGLRKSTKDKDVFVRYSTLIMYDDGFTFDQIASALGIGSKSVQRAVKIYFDEGIEAVAVYKYVGKSCELTLEELSILEEELTINLYTDCREVQKWVLETFGIEYTVSGIRKLLIRQDFVYKKTKILPGKADLEAQEMSIAEILGLINNQGNSDSCFFIDGVHPTHNVEPCRGWVKKGKEYTMPSNTGRQRININGAMNAIKPTEIYTDYTDSVNSQSTQRLVEKILANNPEKRRITIISDNAKYYKNAALNEWLLTQERVKWVFLPPYSPNLNLIERMWRFMRKKVLSGYYYETYDNFKKTVKSFFENIGEYEDDLRSLMTLKFQRLNWDA